MFTSEADFAKLTGLDLFQVQTVARQQAAAAIRLAGLEQMQAELYRVLTRPGLLLSLEEPHRWRWSWLALTLAKAFTFNVGEVGDLSVEAVRLALVIEAIETAHAYQKLATLSRGGQAVVTALQSLALSLLLSLTAANGGRASVSLLSAYNRLQSALSASLQEESRRQAAQQNEEDFYIAALDDADALLAGSAAEMSAHLAGLPLFDREKWYKFGYALGVLCQIERERWPQISYGQTPVKNFILLQALAVHPQPEELEKAWQNGNYTELGNLLTDPICTTFISQLSTEWQNHARAALPELFKNHAQLAAILEFLTPKTLNLA